MLYQAKVSNTKKYEDSQGSHIVTPAKLILLDRGRWDYPTPALISETEEIEEGDKFYYLNYKYEPTIKEKTEENQRGLYSGNKILALPEHFSDKHLQAIVDGKMKDGDEVLVKCDWSYNNNSKENVGDHFTEEEYKDFVRDYTIHLDQQNHITIFPAKHSLEEAALEYSKKAMNGLSEEALKGNPVTQAFKAGAEWAKKNNY